MQSKSSEEWHSFLNKKKNVQQVIEGRYLYEWPMMTFSSTFGAKPIVILIILFFQLTDSVFDLVGMMWYS